MPPAQTCSASAGTALAGAAMGEATQCGLVVEHHLSAYYHSRDLALPLFGGRCLEQQGVAWDDAECEEPKLAADLVSRAWLKERYCCAEDFAYSRGSQQALILHTDNGNAMHAATLESRLEELGVLKYFSGPRISNETPYSESLFRTLKYRPVHPRRPFGSKPRHAPGCLRLSTGTTTLPGKAASNS